jgi:antitoxin HigA-1
MLTTKRKPATVGEILVEEFMQPLGLTRVALAEAMGVQRKHVNELCDNRRNVTATTPSFSPACSATPPTSG